MRSRIRVGDGGGFVLKRLPSPPHFSGSYRNQFEQLPDYASAKYHALRRDIEKLFPAAEATPADKRALLEHEVRDSNVERWLPKRRTQVSPSALFEIEMAHGEYYRALEASDLTLSSQGTYMKQAENFVQWLKGEFDPGCRLAPYRAKKAATPK